MKEYSFRGKCFKLTKGTFKSDKKGLDALASSNRLGISGITLRYKRYINDFPAKSITNVWDDTSTGSFTESKIYAVQTGTKVIERCLLMTTKPGDFVLDPTCGSGTTAYVAEHWGRRWITTDTSRVPLAMARQRLLTATFKYFELKEPARGPAGGFVYREKKNRKGEHVGGIVPHISLGSIANNEPPKHECWWTGPLAEGFGDDSERHAVESGGGFDDVRDVAAFEETLEPRTHGGFGHRLALGLRGFGGEAFLDEGFLLLVGELAAAVLSSSSKISCDLVLGLVRGQIEVATRGDAFQLLGAEREFAQDVHAGAGVVGEVGGRLPVVFELSDLTTVTITLAHSPAFLVGPLAGASRRRFCR